MDFVLARERSLCSREGHGIPNMYYAQCSLYSATHTVLSKDKSASNVHPYFPGKGSRYDIMM